MPSSETIPQTVQWLYENRLLALSVIHPILKDIGGYVSPDDVIQEAALNLWKAGDRAVLVKTYVLQTVRNTAISYRRRWKPTVPLDVTTRETVDLSEVEDPVCSKYKDEIEAVLAAMPERWAEIMRCFYILDMSIADIARTMHLSEGTVKRRLFDGRRKFKEIWLSEMEGTVTELAS